MEQRRLGDELRDISNSVINEPINKRANEIWKEIVPLLKSCAREGRSEAQYDIPSGFIMPGLVKRIREISLDEGIWVESSTERHPGALTMLRFTW